MLHLQTNQKGISVNITTPNLHTLYHTVYLTLMLNMDTVICLKPEITFFF